MYKIDELKEISKIKKKKYYSSLLLIMNNEDKNIILYDSKGIIHIYDSKNNFQEKLIVEIKKEINYISLKNKNEITKFIYLNINNIF